MFQSVLFIFNTEKIFYEINEKKKKEEKRKGINIEVKFNPQNLDNQSLKVNPESNIKTDQRSKAPESPGKQLNISSA